MFRILFNPKNLPQIFLVFALLFLSNCSPDGSSNSSNNQLLYLADSISMHNPAAADSIYSLILSDNSCCDETLKIKTLVGLAMLQIDLGKLDEADSLLKQAQILIPEIADTTLLFKFHLASGYLYNNLENFTKAQEEFEQGYQLALRSKSIDNQHVFRLNLGQVFYELGRHNEAALLLTEELRYADSTKNEFNQSIALKNLARVAASTKDYKSSVAFTKRSLENLKSLNSSVEYANQMMNLGVYYKCAGLNDSALIAYDVAYIKMTETGDVNGMMKVRFNRANIYKNQGKYKEAELEMNQIVRECKAQNIPEGQVYAMNSLASIYKETGRENQSIAMMDSSLRLAKEYRLINSLIKLYENQHRIFYQFKRYREAYEAAIESAKLADSLVGIEKQKEILALNKKYDAERKESEIKILKKNNELQRLHFWLLLVASALGSLTLLLLILILLRRQKHMRQSKQLLEEMAIRAEHEKRSKEIELEKTTIEKQLKEQELVYQSLVHADLVQVNRSVKETLSRFALLFSRKRDQDDFQRTLDSITRDAIRDPLSEFELLFKQLHTSFYEKLIAIAPDLTKTELQVCAMLRLNLSSKDIARLINLNLSTIEITRHHIRKKLNLEHSDTLTTFLIAL